MKQFFSKHWMIIAAIAALIVVIIVVFYYGKKKGSGNFTIVDDTGKPVEITNEQKQAAMVLAQKIHEDLNSGWFFGHNFWGNFRAKPYEELAGLSDTMFALTCQTYRDQYGSSLIKDIREETSLPDDNYPSKSPKRLILEKAERLKIN